MFCPAYGSFSPDREVVTKTFVGLDFPCRSPELRSWWTSLRFTAVCTSTLFWWVYIPLVSFVCFFFAPLLLCCFCFIHGIASLKQRFCEWDVVLPPCDMCAEELLCSWTRDIITLWLWPASVRWKAGDCFWMGWGLQLLALLQPAAERTCVSNLSLSESDAGGGVDRAATGSAAHLGSARVRRPAGAATGPARPHSRGVCTQPVWGALWQGNRKCMNFDRKEKRQRRDGGGEQKGGMEVRERVRWGKMTKSTRMRELKGGEREESFGLEEEAQEL